MVLKMIVITSRITYLKITVVEWVEMPQLGLKNLGQFGPHGDATNYIFANNFINI